MNRLSGHAQYIGGFTENDRSDRLMRLACPPPVIPKLADKMGYVRG